METAAYVFLSNLALFFYGIYAGVQIQKKETEKLKLRLRLAQVLNEKETERFLEKMETTKKNGPVPTPKLAEILERAVLKREANKIVSEVRKEQKNFDKMFQN